MDFRFYPVDLHVKYSCPENPFFFIQVFQYPSTKSKNVFERLDFHQFLTLAEPRDSPEAEAKDTLAEKSKAELQQLWEEAKSKLNKHDDSNINT